MVILILMYGIAVSSGPAVCGLSSFWLKRHSVKKDPCGTVPLQGPTGGFSSGGVGGGGRGELMRTRKRKQTWGVRVHAPPGKFQI